MFKMYCTEDMDYTIGGYYIFNVRALLSIGGQDALNPIRVQVPN